MRPLLWVFALFVMPLGLSAQSLPRSMFYEGYLTDLSDSPLNGTVNLAFEVVGRTGFVDCRLMMEDHTSVTVTDGQFRAVIGRGTSRQIPSGKTVWDLYGSKPIAGVDDGNAGCSFDPAAADARRLLRVFVEGNHVGTLEILHAPLAMVADRAGQVGDHRADSLLRVEDAGVPATIAALNSTEYNELSLLAKGTSTSYDKRGVLAGSALPTLGAGEFLQWGGAGWQGASPVMSESDPTVQAFAKTALPNCPAGQVLKADGVGFACVADDPGPVYGDASTTEKGLVQIDAAGGIQVNSGVISLGPSGVGAGTYPKVTVDPQGRVTSGQSLVEADIPTLSTAGRVSGSAITSGTIGGSTNVSTTGSVAAASVGTRTLEIFKSDNSRKITLTAPAGLGADYALTLPTTTGTSGQVLSSNGSGVLSWVNRLDGAVTSVSGVSPINVGGTTSAPQVSLANSGVAAGTYKSVTVTEKGLITAGSNPTTLAGFGITDGVVNGGQAGAVSIGPTDANALTFMTSNAPRVTVTGTGSVGLGTTNPESQLHATGAVTVGSGVVPMVAAGAGDLLAGNGNGSFQYSASGYDLMLQRTGANASSSGMVFRKSRGTSATPAAATGGDDVGMIQGFAHDGSTFRESSRITLDTEGTISAGIAPGAIRFYTANGATGTVTQGMHLDSSARLGVGAVDPDLRLTVVAPSPTTSQVSLRSSRSAIATGNSIGGIEFMSNDTNLAAPGIVVSRVRSLAEATHTASNLSTGIAFDVTNGTTSSEAVRISAAGRVGIGTSTPGAPLDVKGDLRLSGSTSGYVGFSPAPAAGSTTYVLPSSAGTAGQFLTSDGGSPTATLSWTTAPGETNTASNVGTGGVDVFKEKVGADLRFKRVNAASTKVSVVSADSHNRVDIDVNEANLTLGNMAGILPLNKGGTNASIAPAAGGIVYSTATSMAVSGAGSTGQILRSSGTGAPSWSAATYPSTTTANQLLYSSGANVVAGLPSAVNSVLLTNASGVPSWNTTSGDHFPQYLLLGGRGGGQSIAGGISAGGNLFLDSTTSATKGNIVLAPSGGAVGVGQLSPSAFLHLRGGATAAGTAPLKFSSGSFLTAAENGAFEYDGTSLTFTTNNQRRVIAGANGTVANAIPAGTVAAPGLAVIGDQDTGLYAPSANQLAITTGGTMAASFTANGDINLAGNIGIRDAAPAAGTALNSSLSIGANSTRHGINNLLTLNGTQTLTAGRTAYGAYNDVTSAVPDANTATYGLTLMGAYNRARGSASANGDGAATALYGAYNYALAQSSGAKTISSSFGSYNHSSNTGAAPITNAYGIYNYVQQNNAAAVTTNAYGMRSQITNTNGTVTNAYTLYGAYTGTFGTKWGIYLSGEDKSYFSGSVGVGTVTPAASAALDVTSTTKGFLLPRMTTAQRDAVAGPVPGLQIYNASTGRVNIYNGSSWSVVGHVLSGDVTAALGYTPLNRAGDTFTGTIEASTTGGARVTASSGTATAPTFSFSGNTNTGMYRPAVNSLALTTAGVSRVHVDSAGNVGFGTSAPAERVDLGGGNIKMGYEIVTQAFSNAYTATAVCPAGKYVISGGCQTTQVAYIFDSYPSAVDSWTCYMSATVTTLTVRAVCVNMR